jgi:hypothetical protein
MLNSIQVKLIMPLALFAIILIIVGCIYIHNTKVYYTELVGISTADTMTKQIHNLLLFYNKTIVDSIKKYELRDSHDPLDENAIFSLPYLLNALGKSFEKEYSGVSIKLYSRFPSKNKPDTERYDLFV